MKLKTSAGKSLGTIKLVNNVLASSSMDDPDIQEIIESAFKACVKEYEITMKDPRRYAEYVPDLYTELHDAFQLLSQYWKENFCKNCCSAICKNGETVDPKANGSMRCNVKIRGSQKKWRILSNTLMNDEDFLHSSSTTPKLVPRKEIFYDSPSPYTHFCLVCFSADIGNKTRTSGIYSLPVQKGSLSDRDESF